MTEFFFYFVFLIPSRMISGQYLEMGALPYSYVLTFVTVFPAYGTKKKNVCRTFKYLYIRSL